MALQHLRTLVLICCLCGVHKVNSYETVQYQSALRRLLPPSPLRPRSYTHYNEVPAESDVKGGGAPYYSAFDQQSSLTHDQRGIHHHTGTSQGEVAQGEVPQMSREQVKLIPVLQGRPGMTVAQSQVIQFGSAQSGSTSSVADRLLSRFKPPRRGSAWGSTVGSQREGDQSLPTSSAFSRYPSSHSSQAPSTVRFGSGQNTGTSFSSNFNMASSGSGFHTSERNGWRNPNLPARRPSAGNAATGYFTSWGVTLPKPTSSQYVDTNAALGSPLIAQILPHHSTQSSSETTLPSRFNSSPRYIPHTAWSALEGSFKPISSSYGSSSVSGSVIGHPSSTHDHNVPSGSRDVPHPTHSVEYTWGGATPSPSLSFHLTRHYTRVVKPDMDSTSPVYEGGSSGHRLQSSRHSSGGPAGTGLGEGYTKSGSGFDHSSPSGVVYIQLVPGGGIRRSYRCVGEECSRTG